MIQCPCHPRVAQSAARKTWLGRRGSSTVEFALVSTLFMSLLLLTMEVCYDLAVGAALDHGAHVASRFGTTGSTTAAGVPGTDRMTTLQGLVIQGSGNLLRPERLQMMVSNYPNVADAVQNTDGSSGPGTAGQVVVYTLTYSQPYLTPIAAVLAGNDALIHTSSVVVLNEPY